MMGSVKIYAPVEGGEVNTDYSEWFAGRLREALGSMPQADLLKLLKQNGFDMTQQRLSHYMQGRNYPDPPVLKELAKALGVSADWLLGLTEQSLPVADLDEMVAQAKGEGKLNKVMRNLSPDKQQQVYQFAEFLLSRQPAIESYVDGLSESERIAHEAHKWLDSIERTRGTTTRKEIEKVFRDRNLFVDSAS